MLSSRIIMKTRAECSFSPSIKHQPFGQRLPKEWKQPHIKQFSCPHVGFVHWGQQPGGWFRTAPGDSFQGNTNGMGNTASHFASLEFGGQVFEMLFPTLVNYLLSKEHTSQILFLTKNSQNS